MCAQADGEMGRSGAEGAAHLAEAVALPNCPLATLCLSCNGLGDEGIDLLTAALVKTQDREKGLAAIELGFNRIYSSGVRAFSKCLADGCTLRSVNLSDNGLGMVVVRKALAPSAIPPD